MSPLRSPTVTFLLLLCLAATRVQRISAFSVVQRHPQRPTTHLCADNSIGSPPATDADNSSLMSGTYVRCSKCQTIYAIAENDLGPRGRGRRLECSVCSHSWFQSKSRLMELKEGYEMVALPATDLSRIQLNMKEGKKPSFMGAVKLYVGNISFQCQEADIRELFSSVGDVGDVSLVRDEQGRIRGFGFVSMRHKEDGPKAIEQLDGAEIKGREIAVRESNS